jgi:glycosyltransferase involved in cell wall biosynthesis
LKIWIFQTGEPLHTDPDSPRPMRAMNLANALVDEGHQVIVWSSAFYHQKKSHRTREFTSLTVSDSLKVNLIPSRGYDRNIGFARLMDHYELGKNLLLELDKAAHEELPDIAFVGYPPIEFAYTVAKFCKKHKLPFILDAKDMWPDYFVEKIPRPFRFLGPYIFRVWYRMSEFIFENATGYSTISQGYMNWMCQVGKRKTNDYDCIAPTSTSYEDIDESGTSKCVAEWAEKGISIGKDNVFFYAGTINKTLDFEPVLFAAEELRKMGKNIKIVICGSGPQLESFRQLFKELDNVIFTGWISRDMLLVLARNATASLIPYRNSKAFTLGIPNKFSDALSIGIPILSCLEGEVKQLIVSKNIGFYYKSDEPKALLEACLKYLDSPCLVENHSENSKKLYAEQFDTSEIYRNLIEKMGLVVGQNRLVSEGSFYE